MNRGNRAEQNQEKEAGKAGTMVDFHIHTTRTDGMLTPEQVVEKAVQSGLKAIALTDHNYIHEDLNDLRSKYSGKIQLINGLELSTTYIGLDGKATEVHVVALGFDNKIMKTALARNKRDFAGYINEMCAKLRRCGMDVPMYDGLQKAYPEHQRMQRLQLADYLIRNGFVGSIDEVFEKYIGAHGERRAFADPLKYAEYIPFQDGVAAIRAAGGIPVLAHLFKYRFSEREAMRMIQMFTEAAGKDAAMEVYYGKFSKGKQFRLAQIADNWSLLRSSGSDYHALGKKDQLLPVPHIYGCPLGKHVAHRLAAKGILRW